MIVSEQSLSILSASPPQQLRILNNANNGLKPLKPFEELLAEHNLKPLAACSIEVFQVNVGKFCNQTCKHCHVDAGPHRTEENMSQETFELCIDLIRSIGSAIIDITGGAPELNPHFRWFVEQVRSLGCHVIDRCNLTVLQLQSQPDLAEFLADQQVEIVASLPSFTKQRTDAQRGDGVFAKSIAALRKLNNLGYGKAGSSLLLNLVYNPTGAFLPPSQSEIEEDYHHELRKRYGIEFNSLYTITNMPISRYLEFLIRSGNYEQYMEKLINAFNPAALEGVMCRNMISIGWDGRLYDCDFNQMLDIEVGYGAPRHLSEFNLESLSQRCIMVGQHCYGCTAGTGSSCNGATT